VAWWIKRRIWRSPFSLRASVHHQCPKNIYFCCLLYRVYIYIYTTFVFFSVDGNETKFTFHYTIYYGVEFDRYEKRPCILDELNRKNLWGGGYNFFLLFKNFYFTPPPPPPKLQCCSIASSSRVVTCCLIGWCTKFAGSKYGCHTTYTVPNKYILIGC
jgi:hypothetical protein